jgi:cellulose synthase (UDP-forming)
VTKPHPRPADSAGYRVVTERVFGRVDLAVFATLTALQLASAVLFTRYWFSHGYPDDPVFWAATLLLFPSLAMWQLRWFALPLMRRPQPVPPEHGLRVAVVTTFVPSAEPVEMLSETVHGLVALEYPHDTWVLDEGDDPLVRELCSALGARHFSRQGKPHYQQPSGRFQARSKHGNYNAWLQEVGFSGYDVVVTFDPDHVPRPEFLQRTLGYLRDADVVFVQAPQVYYNQSASFIARGAAEETYAFYSSIQMAGFAAGFPLVVGCHTVHRTSALAAIGGLAAHDADDLATTLLYLANGGSGVYVPEVLAAGLTPVDWKTYLRQQRRWARSVLDVKLRVLPTLIRRLPPRAKVGAALHGFYYLNGLLVPLGVAFLCFLLVTGRTPLPLGTSTALWLALVWAALIAGDLYRQLFFLQPREEAGLLWRSALLRFAKWPFLTAAVFDLFRTRPREYELTLKLPGGPEPRLSTIVHLATAGVVAVALAIGTARGNVTPSLLSAIALAVIFLSLTVTATEFLRFPLPYDRALARERSLPSRTKNA